MEDKVKQSIDLYIKDIKEKLSLENIKTQIEPILEDEDALEYFEDKLEEVGYLIDDAEELIGTTILNLDDDD